MALEASQMLREAMAAPAAVHDLLATSSDAISALADELRAASIRTVVTVARGSSDHAAAHFAYALVTRMGILTTSIPPSAITLYDAPVETAGVAAVAFSQSGQSPDLVTTASVLQRRGAITAAFVNDVRSPLAQSVAHAIDLAAGQEASVAATKSFITQLVAGLQLVASWGRDHELLDAINGVSLALSNAACADWSAGVEPLLHADRMFVVARGQSLAIAAEMALKLKEICAIQAEAFSSAEVRHGPMALIGLGYPLLVLAPSGPGQAELLAFADQMRGQGANVLLAGSLQHPSVQLPISVATHELLEGICAVQSFYVMAEALARARGLNPDYPPRLSKVTRTR